MDIRKFQQWRNREARELASIEDIDYRYKKCIELSEECDRKTMEYGFVVSQNLYWIMHYAELTKGIT